MRASLALIWTITAAATLLQGANGLLQVLLPLRMQADGMSITAVGLVAAGYGFGFAAGCFIAPALIRHVGHIRAYASLAALSAVVALTFTQADSVATWIGLRVISGVTLAGLFTVIDGWISARATAGNRGRVISVYMICTKVALMLSPLGIGLGAITGEGLFMLIAAMMSLSLIPVSATVSDEPRAPTTVRLTVGSLFAAAPSAVVGAFAVGLMNGPVIAITPVYGVRAGLGPEAAAVLLLALQGGSLLAQWPLGWLSDHLDRRKVIAGLAAGTGLVSVAILWATARGDAILLTAAFGMWGGLALCIYAVCVAHACDLVSSEDIVPTISSLLMCWAAGVTIGPLPAAWLMSAIGPEGLFLYSAAVSFLLAAFVVFRIARKTRRAAGGGFVNVLATSPATAELGDRSGLGGRAGAAGDETTLPDSGRSAS